MSSQADHGGHRERMRKRFKESGNFKGFPSMRYLKCFYFTLCRERTPMILRTNL